ncbi:MULTISPECIES: hypothetical protein [Gammaproteobacteria]|jgi:hypothetical protein|uniref:Uncharacterized protein n=1 Tax=Stutzerimonas frequens TaxID=2968969 RepID=A0AA47E6A6_9GAMM|nr:MULTISPECIES: hypothetical protein [Pseudomonadaceae]QLJ25435.1 hypothetical protein HZZ08_24110 [Serratia marcescens]HBC25689.1 hypothetical protein [Pseudomonas sp.]AJO78626.1 hypothetical protein TO66_15485 [Pseudomonas sp. MRSN 12121]MUI52118.1 hypothetical protein [Pseudomonas aeruginosa]MUT71665.1 hypothetical protein [Stutzerimonas frequens]|tara:strand:- start:1266 stop:1574 length:309 start_codon:yes stop_codon:yes gene_type:complete
MIMRHVATEPTETTSDVTCDACCQSTSVEGYGHQFGVLQACWGYGSKHDGERYEIHLCESCFFRALAMLRRERMVNTMFDDEPDTNQDEFGLVRKDDFWAEG